MSLFMYLFIYSFLSVPILFDMFDNNELCAQWEQVGSLLCPGAPNVQKWAEGKCELYWEAYSGCCLAYIHLAIDFLYVYDPCYSICVSVFAYIPSMVI